MSSQLLRARRTSHRAAALAFASAAAILAPRVARAQYQSQTISLAAGVSTPRGTFADSLKPGYHVTAGIGFHFGESFTLRMEGSFQDLQRKLAGTSRDNQMVRVGGAVELAPFGVIGPYAVGGYGFSQVLKSGTTPASQWTGTYDAGGGYRYSWPRLSIFGEVRYYRLRSVDGPAMIPWSIGIRL